MHAIIHETRLFLKMLSDAAWLMDELTRHLKALMTALLPVGKAAKRFYDLSFHNVTPFRPWVEMTGAALRDENFQSNCYEFDPAAASS